MSEPEINMPEVPWGPLIGASVAGVGASMLFPVAAPLFTASAAATGIGMPIAAVIGGIGGWFLGKRFSKTSETEYSDSAAIPGKPVSSLTTEPGLSLPEKQWTKAEEAQKVTSRER